MHVELILDVFNFFFGLWIKRDEALQDGSYHEEVW